MLYKFKSKASGDVIMQGEPGDALLRLMGREPAPKGIFEAAALPGLIASLEAGVAADEAPPADPDASGSKRTGVSLRQRAWPLRELMLAAQREGADVVWGV